MHIFDAAGYERTWRRLQDGDAGGLALLAGRALLWSLVPLYQGASLAKKALFSLSFLRTRLPVLTVSVGNVTVGGSGKTAMTRYLCGLLHDRLGLDTAVLCRGYRSSNRAEVRLVSERGRMLVDADCCGDEACLLARKLPHCSVVLGRKRAVTGAWAVDELGVDAVVLDDGLQYWRLERDLDIVMVGVEDGLGNGLPFPRGPLREPASFGLSRAGCVVLHHASEGGGDRSVELEAQIGRLAGDAPVLRSFLRVLPLRPARPSGPASKPGTGSTQRSLARAGGGFLAFCGIGSPASFRSTLEARGLKVLSFETFPDHHVYSEEDIRGLKERARRLGAVALVTTEKDEANIRRAVDGEPPLLVLPVETALSAEDEQVLLDLLARKVETLRGRHPGGRKEVRGGG